VTVPFPVPDDPAVIVSQLALLVAVQLQGPEVTATLPAFAAAGLVIASGTTL
jgi:hypothetical protein